MCDKDEPKIQLQKLSIANLPKEIYDKPFKLNIIDRVHDIRGSHFFCLNVTSEETVEQVKKKLVEGSGMYKFDDIELIVEEKNNVMGKNIMKNDKKLKDYGIVCSYTKMIIDVVPKKSAKDWVKDPEGMTLFNFFMAINESVNNLSNKNYQKGGSKIVDYEKEYIKYKKKYLKYKKIE